MPEIATSLLDEGREENEGTQRCTHERGLISRPKKVSAEPQSTFSTSIGSRECWQVAILLAIWSGEYAELTPEDCPKTMEGVSWFIYRYVELSSSDFWLSYQVPHAYSLAEEPSWLRLLEPHLRRSTKQVYTISRRYVHSTFLHVINFAWLQP